MLSESLQVRDLLDALGGQEQTLPVIVQVCGTSLSDRFRILKIKTEPRYIVIEAQE